MKSSVPGTEGRNKQLAERAGGSARFRYEVNDIEKAIGKNDRQLQ